MRGIGQRAPRTPDSDDTPCFSDFACHSLSVRPLQKGYGQEDAPAVSLRIIGGREAWLQVFLRGRSQKVPSRLRDKVRGAGVRFLRGPAPYRACSRSAVVVADGVENIEGAGRPLYAPRAVGRVGGNP